MSKIIWTILGGITGLIIGAYESYTTGVWVLWVFGFTILGCGIGFLLDRLASKKLGSKKD